MFSNLVEAALAVQRWMPNRAIFPVNIVNGKKQPQVRDYSYKLNIHPIVIQNWFTTHPYIGLALGPEVGPWPHRIIPGNLWLIDIEADCEEGNRNASRLYGHFPTPTFGSPRSVHRLFGTYDYGKQKRLAHLRCNKYEIDGVEYRVSGMHPEGAANSREEDVSFKIKHTLSVIPGCDPADRAWHYGFGQAFHEIPDGVIERLEAYDADKTPKHSLPHDVVRFDPSTDDDRFNQCVKSILRIEGPETGRSQNPLYRVAQTAVNGYGLNESQAMEAVLIWAAGYFDRKLDEVRRAIKSTLRTGDREGHPRGFEYQKILDYRRRREEEVIQHGASVAANLLAHHNN